MQGTETDPSGSVVLQRLDAAGAAVEETLRAFTAQAADGSVLAQDRVATVITTEDLTVIEPIGWQGEVPTSVDLVLTKDGTLNQLSVLQADAHTVAPVRWVDRGTLIVRVVPEGGPVHYVLWDTQNGGTRLLTQLEEGAQHEQGPVLGALGWADSLGPG